MSHLYDPLRELKVDLELVSLRLLGAYSPRACAWRLRKIQSRLAHLAEVDRRLATLASRPALPLKATNGGDNPAQLALL